MKKQDLENAEQYLTDVKRCAKKTRNAIRDLITAVKSSLGTTTGFPVYLRDYWVERFCAADENCKSCSDMMREMLRLIEAGKQMKDISNVEGVMEEEI